MNTTHTPGPWKLSYESPGSPWAQIIAPVRRLATDAEHRVCELRIADPEHAANAAVIAAAPELLAALQGLADRFRDWTAGDEAALAAAEAAIAKATTHTRT